MADPAQIKAVTNCFVRCDLKYSIEDDEDLLVLTAVFDQDWKILPVRISEITRETFADALIKLGESLK